MIAIDYSQSKIESPHLEYQQTRSGSHSPVPHSPYLQQGYPPQNFPPQGYPPESYPPQNYPQQHYQSPQGPPIQHQGYPPSVHGYLPPQPINQQYYGYNQQQPYGAPQASFPAPRYNQSHNGFQTFQSPPTPGYGPEIVPLEDATVPADALYNAMKGIGTRESTVIRILAQYPATSIPHLKRTYEQRHHESLEVRISKETSFNFKACLLSILRGPLANDIKRLNQAIAGLGTDEYVLTHVLLARSNADIQAIKQSYLSQYGRTLESDVKGDLSGKTELLFSMALSATRQDEFAPVIPQNIDADVAELHRAIYSSGGKDQLTACSILTSRSDGQIRAIAQNYERKYATSLEAAIIKAFTGHMESALVRIVRAASDRAMADAMLLNETMPTKVYTRDEQLIAGLVAIHWNRDHMEQVKGAYKVKYPKDGSLAEKVKKQLSGNYEKVLLAMIG